MSNQKNDHYYETKYEYEQENKTMTRKHFKDLALAISTIANDLDRRNVSERIGEVCAKNNPRFDWSRWKEACKVEEVLR